MRRREQPTAPGADERRQKERRGLKAEAKKTLVLALYLHF